MRSLEDLIQETSGTRLAQVFIVGFVSLSRLCTGWCFLALSFANFVPKWCCLPDNLPAIPGEYCRKQDQFNGSMFGKRCQVNETSCSRRVFATGIRTFVYEWDLVCERRWMVPTTTSIQMAGLLVGGLLSGQMSDLFGRKKTLYFFTATCAVFCFLAAFSTSWEMFASAIFLIGASLGGYSASCIPYTTEFVLPSSRGLVTVLPSWNIGVCLMALAAWRLQDWSMLYWMCGVMRTPLLLPYFFIPESLRWLTVKGRVDEAQQVVEWIARWNKQEVPKDSLEVIKVTCIGRDLTEVKRFTLSLCGYGFSFGVSSFGTNVYLNIFLLQALSMLGLMAVSLMIPRMDCKKTAIIFLILASACGFGSMAVNLTLSGWQWKTTAEIILNLFSRGMLAAAWGTIAIVTNETYPTVIRGLGFGASNVTARVGAVLSPFLLNFEDGPTLALAIVGGSLLLAAFAVTFLRETSGKAMAESIEAAGKTTDKQLEIEAPQNSMYLTEHAAETNNYLGDLGDIPFKNDSTRM